MMNKFKNIDLKYIKRLAIVAVIVVIICLPFLSFHLSTDAYWILTNFSETLTNPLVSFSGRPISDFILYYFNIINMNINLWQVFFNLLAIIITFISVVVMHKTIQKLTSDKKISSFLTLMSLVFTFYNFFGYELFLFNVFFSISIQYLLIAISLKLIVEKQNIKNIFIAIILNFIGLCIYQGAGVLFLPLAFILIGYKYISKSFSTFIRELLKAFSVYAGACFLNLLYIKLLPIASRYEGEISIINNLKSILSVQKNLWLDTFGIFPRNFFILIMMFLIIICLLIAFFPKKNNNMKIRKILILFSAIISTIVFSFAPLVISNIVIVPRIVMIISSLPGVLLLYILIFGEIKFKKDKVSLYTILTLFSFGYSLLMVNASSTMINGLVKTNKADQDEVREVEKIIQEKASTEIKYLAFFPDQNITWLRVNYFPGMDAYLRAYSVSWSRLGITNYVTKKNYLYKDIDLESPDFKNVYEKYNDYCSKNDWTKLDESQVNIYIDTAFICIY